MEMLAPVWLAKVGQVFTEVRSNEILKLDVTLS